jgi:hypothetical protein
MERTVRDHYVDIAPSSSDAADISRAKEIQRGAIASAEEIVALSTRLLRGGLYSHCRHMLAVRLRTSQAESAEDTYAALVRNYVLSCSEDPGLRSHEELGRALNLLHKAIDLTTTNDAGSLIIAGAAHKRSWDLRADKSDIERALAYYLRGYDNGSAEQRCDAGLAAAYLLDVLTCTEDRTADERGATSRTKTQQQEQSRQIREEVARTLSERAERPDGQRAMQSWHFVVQRAEATFGLQRYDEAQRWLEVASKLPASERDIEKTARHLTMLARMQEGDRVRDVAQSPAWRCLLPLVGSDVLALQAATLGKVGLALSGGGTGCPARNRSHLLRLRRRHRGRSLLP